MTSVPWSTANGSPGSKCNPTVVGVGLEQRSLRIRWGIANDRCKPKSVLRGALRAFSEDPQPDPASAAPTTTTNRGASNRGYRDNVGFVKVYNTFITFHFKPVAASLD
jgi:hypothetical protein